MVKIEKVGDQTLFNQILEIVKILNSINESDIKAYVDLKGLGEGRYTKEIIVKGANPLAIYKVKRTEATIVISKK